jgi:hypothetical protein
MTAYAATTAATYAAITAYAATTAAIYAATTAAPMLPMLLPLLL